MTKEEFSKFDSDFEVCECMGVSLSEIEDSIKNGCDNLDCIEDKTDAGSGCGICKEKDKDSDKELHIDEILDCLKNK